MQKNPQGEETLFLVSLNLARALSKGAWLGLLLSYTFNLITLRQALSCQQFP